MTEHGSPLFTMTLMQQSEAPLSWQPTPPHVPQEVAQQAWSLEDWIPGMPPARSQMSSPVVFDKNKFVSFFPIIDAAASALQPDYIITELYTRLSAYLRESWQQ